MKSHQTASLILALLAPLASLWAQPLVSSNTTVVLVAGLPGDLPSEQTYRAQAEAWLQWLGAQPHPPRRTFLLWDTEPIPASPESLGVVFLPARRQVFLDLTNRIPSAESLLLVAWGHGGSQRSTPVFHVRGARLTPDDFKQFTEAAAARGVVVLMFRGSGAFARPLAREGLTILSSDQDIVFESDPIGMDLLLKALQPKSQLDSLARTLGRATRDWYETRQLARTEEPTLWSPAGPSPLQLARIVEPKAGSAQVEPGSDQAREAEEEAPVPLGPRWSDVRPADPQDYPGWDGVILKQDMAYSIAQQPAIIADTELFLQILTPQGLALADFNFSFAPPDEELEILDAEARLADGELLRLDLGDVHETLIGAELDYPGRRQKFFSIPGAVPGAILHVRYRSTWRVFPMPSVSLRIPFPDDLPVSQLRLQIEVPREQPLHFRFNELAAPDPVVMQREYGARYTWTFADLQPLPDEPFAPPDQSPMLLLSTWPDWETFAAWYDRITRLSDTLTPEIIDAARQLTEGSESDLDKIRAIYEYVTGLRYVAVPLGVNSFRPHAAANVLKNQFGDCKDKANLFNVMLRSLHFDARLVLVPRFAQAYEDLPGLAFNHAISKVSSPDGILWIDTTDDLCRFGLLPPGDPGRSALVVDDGTTHLVSLPLPRPGDHGLQLKGRIVLDSAQAHSTEWTAHSRGYADYSLRSLARERNPRQLSPLLEEELEVLAGVFVCARQTYTPFSDLTTNFSWAASGQTFGLISPLTPTNRFLLRLPAWLPAGWAQTLHPRRSALFLNEGYPLLLGQEITFELGPEVVPKAASSGAAKESFRVLNLPRLARQEEDPLRWELSWRQSGPDKLVGQLRIELAQGNIDTAETPRFQAQLKSLFQALLTTGPILER